MSSMNVCHWELLLDMLLNIPTTSKRVSDEVQRMARPGDGLSFKT